MNIALLILHVVLSLSIITLVLLQKGAGASAGAAFGGGGGGAGSVFGATGSSNFLSKSTAILATAFFANSLLLAYLAAHRDMAPEGVIDRLLAPGSQVENVVPSPDVPVMEMPASEVPAFEMIAPAEVDQTDDSVIPPAE